MPHIIPFLLATGTLLVSLLLSWRLTQPGSRFYFLDQPNQRSLHDRPVPRNGGLAIMTAILIGGAAAVALAGGYDNRVYILGAAVIVIGVISLLDDRKPLPPLIRLLVHLALAVGIAFAGFECSWGIPGTGISMSGAVATVLTVLFIAWMINLFNFMDGMDGFAGGMAVTGFLTLAVMGYVSQQYNYALLNIVIAASAAGFLVLNYPPAKLFMGDTGSTVLGLLAASMVLWGARDGVMEIYTGLLIFSPFIVDATVTLTRRLFRGEKVWEAHREHSYQKLVLLGYGHRRTVQLEYILMIACAISSIVAAQSAEKVRLGIYGIWIILYILLIILIDSSWKKANGKANGQAD